MCLSVTQGYKVLSEDLIVFKMLIDDGLVLSSPFRFFQWDIGQTYKTQLQEYDETWFYRNQVDEGFHAILSIFQANEAKKWFNRNRCISSEIYRCVIPKGSKIYEGNWNGYWGTASDQIKIVRKVRFYDFIKFMFLKNEPKYVNN